MAPVVLLIPERTVIKFGSLIIRDRSLLANSVSGNIKPPRLDCELERQQEGGERRSVFAYSSRILRKGERMGEGKRGREGAHPR